MATYSGTAGEVRLNTLTGTGGTAVGEMRSWTLNVEAAEIDTSAFGSSWAGYDAGIVTWSGSFSGHEDPSNAVQTALLTNLTAGTKAEMGFRLSNARWYYGTGVITSKTVETAYDTVATTTFNFRGDGALVLT